MLRFIGSITALLLLGGCHFYEVQDRQTGRVYYTEKWVAADGYRGPLSITDEHGNTIRMRDAHVIRLSKEDYVEASAKAREAEEKGSAHHDNP